MRINRLMMQLILFGLLLSVQDGHARDDRNTDREAMTLGRMGAVIKSTADQSQQGAPNYWEFVYFDVRMACVADANHNRMRIISPIVKVEELTPTHKDRMLEANFHTALDARYAINDGIVYSTFIHPLSSLTEEEMKSAMKQVAWLVMTFGDTYSSGELQFGTPE